MDNNAELIDKFRDVTGIEEERAKFYLESAAWNIDIALASFFEEDSSTDRQAGDGEDEPVEVPQSASAGSNPSQNRKVSTISVSESDDSDDEGQAYYVGGSERSGQQVIGPPKKKNKDVVKDVFESARELGAEVVEPGSSRPKKNPGFKGTGYRLGQSEADTQVIPGARQIETRHVTLKLWKTGFSIDDGPLRDYQNPANKEFIEYIKRGEIPQELIKESRGQKVDLRMEDHRDEEFLTRFKAFTGEGQLLGNITPDVVNSAPPAVKEDPAISEAKAKSQLNLQESEPTTNVQIRLADGSRLIGRFNHTHTVGHLRQYIITARPQYSIQPFNLLTTYPSRELSDDKISLQEASLLNATIMQRMK